jgi:hypothetical protein
MDESRKAADVRHTAARGGASRLLPGVGGRDGGVYVWARSLAIRGLVVPPVR